MGKVKELSMIIDELSQCGKTLISISDELRNLFSSSSCENSVETEKVLQQERQTVELVKEEKREKVLTLEDVRAVLADISRNGYTAQVKELLLKHGVNKLSDVQPSEYQELLKEAEVIGNAG
ncbi:putative rRNA biogenesis protein rrp5 [Lachnospiraceae bacterium TWA4]|nr:putative rRNA biogenesis protein rrp5 [Lachnospiraceae bacterium TWA4]